MTSRPVGRLLFGGVCVALAMTSSRAMAQATKTPAKKSAPATSPSPPGVRPASGTAVPKPANSSPVNSAGATAQPKARPVGEPFRIPEPTPEVLQILRDWETTTKKYQRLEGDFHKYTYDLTFMVEKRAIGEFYYESPDKGAYQLKPDSKVTKGMVNNKPVNGENVKLTVGADRPDRWICTGKEVFQFDDPQKTYHMVLIPKEHQGTNIINGPLPFLLGMEANLAKKRWEFKLLKRTESQIWLSARPLQQQDATLYQYATIILDSQTFLPSAVRMLDPAGTVEIVHTFGKLKINKNAANWLGQNPLKPDLKGYKMAQNPEDALKVLNGSPGSRPAPRTASEANKSAPSKTSTTKPGSKTVTK
jgi:TIGR03009 family protein